MRLATPRRFGEVPCVGEPLIAPSEASAIARRPRFAGAEKPSGGADAAPTLARPRRRRDAAAIRRRPPQRSSRSCAITLGAAAAATPLRNAKASGSFRLEAMACKEVASDGPTNSIPPSRSRRGKDRRARSCVGAIEVDQHVAAEDDVVGCRPPDGVRVQQVALAESDRLRTGSARR